jgi:hypothetical protein
MIYTILTILLKIKIFAIKVIMQFYGGRVELLNDNIIGTPKNLTIILSYFHTERPILLIFLCNGDFKQI